MCLDIVCYEKNHGLKSLKTLKLILIQYKNTVTLVFSWVR